jgi:hypothetical protein
MKRPDALCNPKSRRKVKKRPLGLRGPPRSNCRYASIWQCGGEGERQRRMASATR